MARKIRLGLDVDGVLYRWQDTALYLLKTHRGVNLSYDKWGYWDYLVENISKDDWGWLWSDGVKEHGLFRYGSIYKGSREFLQAMEPYCDNVIITSRPADAVRDTMDWLTYQRVPTSEVHIIGRDVKKSSILPRCDVYIDDGLHIVDDLTKNTKAKIIMPDRPWNQRAGVDRYYNWDSMEQALMIMHSEINSVAV